MLKASFSKYQLQFKRPVLTSRGEMKVKNGCFISLSDGGKEGIGECSFIEGLSADNLAGYEQKLLEVCHYLQQSPGASKPDLTKFPSIEFALECVLLDYENGGNRILFRTPFAQGKMPIPINGLVWMGTAAFMEEQIQEKLEQGFRCIKIKVGAIDFQQEVKLLQLIRNKFPSDIIEIRLDANGAFTEDNVFSNLEGLAKHGIHSIEQPVKAGRHDLMQRVCSDSPIPVALDEELIGVSWPERERLLSMLKPSYLILKPSLLGGFASCDNWIEIAGKLQIGWWSTSALESNIGLNAIAQWVSTKNNPMVQGLGTGSLYTNNISSPLFVEGGKLHYSPQGKWQNLFDNPAA